MSPLIRTASIVFLAMTALDIAFALYVIEVAGKNTVAAGLWAAAIQICNAFVVTSFVKDYRMTLPCAAGAFVGTVLAIQYIS